MGGSTGKGSYNQTSTYSPPDWVLAGGRQSVETAQQLANTPFSIPVQPISGFTPQQLQAMQEVQDTQGMANPFYQQGADFVRSGANPDIAKYYGAESEGVVNQLNNIFGQQMAKATGDWQQQAGGIGADRIAIAQSELANQQGLSAGQTLSQIMQQSVGQALTGAQQQQQAGINLGNLGTGAQTAALQGAQSEMASGQIGQQQRQNELNSQYENILQRISWPFQTNQYLAGITSGVGPVMGGTGITSGNTKGSMMGMSGNSLGKGLTALPSLLPVAEGGSIPWDEDAVDGYALGGAVDPLEVGAGRANPLPIPMQSGGMEGVSFGQNGAITQGNPFAGLLDKLYAERDSLLAAHDGAARRAGGGEVGGGPAVPSLLAGSPTGIGKSVVPMLSVQGRPSPQQQQLMQYRGPDPMKLAQDGMKANQSSGQNAPNPFQPSPATYARGDWGGQSAAETAEAAQIGLDSGLKYNPLTGAVEARGGRIGAAEGGAVHMGLGGDPFGGENTPFSLSPEIGRQLTAGIAANMYGGQDNSQPQPFQAMPQVAQADPWNHVALPNAGETAPLPETPAPAPAPPPAAAPPAPAPPSGPPAPSPLGRADARFDARQDWAGQLGDWFKSRVGSSAQGTPPLSIPPTEGEHREQGAIDQLNATAAKPSMPGAPAAPVPQPPTGGLAAAPPASAAPQAAQPPPAAPPRTLQVGQPQPQPDMWSRQGSSADAQAIIDSARRLKMDPRTLAAIMHFESGFNPAATGPSGKGYPVRGLIGFDPANIRKYGEPGKTIAEQMPQVERYMLDRGWKPGVYAPNDLARAYSIVNAGGLDKNGDPYLTRRDTNGSVGEHLQRITNGSYAPADKFLYGDVSRETKDVRTGSIEGTQRNQPDYSGPPGYQGPSKMKQFLYTLATGDPTLAMKEEMMRFGLYEQAAKWDALRNYQYGSSDPRKNGSALADEATGTMKAIGATVGAHEMAHDPASIAGTAAAGRSPAAGASVRPAGGPSPAPAIAPSASAPARTLMDEAIQRQIMGLASGNPAVQQAAGRVLDGMVQRGYIDAHTLNQRIGAAKASFGFIPGLGPVQYTPDGGVRPLMPGSTAAPAVSGLLPPPSPGSMPTQATPPATLGAPAAAIPPATPAPAPAPSIPAAAPSAPTATPARTAPTPLPTGAEPRPAPAGAAAAQGVLSDPAFQPSAQPPRNSAEMAQNPAVSSLAQDERAWTEEGKKMIGAEAQEAMKDARGHLDADRQAEVMLAELKESLARLPKSGMLAPGPTLQLRNHIVGLYNDLARVTAPALGKDALPQVSPDTVGSIEQINKLANTLAFALARTLGSREAVQIVQQARQSVPSADVSQRGALFIMENLHAGIQMDRDYYSGLQNWSASNLLYGNSIKGYDDWFRQTHPPDLYRMRAAAAAARGPKDQPIDHSHLDVLRRNPDQAAKFDAYFQVPGLAEWYLKRWGVSP